MFPATQSQSKQQILHPNAAIHRQRCQPGCGSEALGCCGAFCRTSRPRWPWWMVPWRWVGRLILGWARRHYRWFNEMSQGFFWFRWRLWVLRSVDEDTFASKGVETRDDQIGWNRSLWRGSDSKFWKTSGQLSSCFDPARWFCIWRGPFSLIKVPDSNVIAAMVIMNTLPNVVTTGKSKQRNWPLEYKR